MKVNTGIFKNHMDVSYKMKTNFSTNRVVDPYYILGVEKRTEYDEIK